VVSNGKGKAINYAGPASKLGKAVGYCTRKAVAEALIKQEPFWANRSVIDRLKERQLPLEKLALEVSKVDGLSVNAESLAEILKNNPVALAHLLAATKLDDDVKKNLFPCELGDAEELSSCFSNSTDIAGDCFEMPGYDRVDLPPFLKQALLKIVKKALSGLS
jgi:hypothetical protein